MIVVDASIVANALADGGPDGSTARSMLRRQGDIAAPDLLDVETVSVLRKRWLAGDLTAKRFRGAIEDLSDLPIIRHPALPFMIRAYDLRANITPYDALYITLAEALGCAFVTSDRRLASAPGPRCEVHVVET